MITLSHYTRRIHQVCPVTYLLREDFLFGHPEGMTLLSSIRGMIEELLLPESSVVITYDLIQKAPLPWMTARDYVQGYTYVLLYCTQPEPRLDEALRRQGLFLYNRYAFEEFAEEEYARHAPDRVQYDELRSQVASYLFTRGLLYQTTATQERSLVQ